MPACPWVPFSLALAVVLITAPVRAADANEGWTGNMARNPGFEEDFVNANGEGHVISFKGDWFYNQRDLVPDYWELKGAWVRNDQATHGGRHSLKLSADASAAQSFAGAVYQEGGSAWGAAPTKAIPITT